MAEIGRWIVYLLLPAVGTAAAYLISKGTLKQDIERENKWADYEHRSRKEKR